jgi:hypothetical protein
LGALLSLAFLNLPFQGYAQMQDAALPPVREPFYRSIFEGYQALTERTPTPWRAANDTVREVGGWRAYAKEAAAANAATPTDTPDTEPSSGAVGTPKP